MGATPTPLASGQGTADAEVRRFLEDGLEQIRRGFEPDLLVLFGSRVRGEPTEWSDIDLVLVSRRFEGMRFLDRMRLFRRELRPHLRTDLHIDALCYTPEEFALKASQPTIVAEAVREGIRII